jgi:hypothetical protein
MLCVCFFHTVTLHSTYKRWQYDTFRSILWSSSGTWHCPSAGTLLMFVFHYLLLSKTLIKNFKVKVDSWNPSTYHLEVYEISTPRQFRGPCHNRAAAFLLFGTVFVVNPSHHTIQREEKNSSTIITGTSKTSSRANFINLQQIRTWILTINFKILIGVSLNNR